MEKQTELHPMNAVIAMLLAIGVIVSAIVLGIGLIVFVASGAAGAQGDLRTLLGPQATNPAPHSVGGVFRGLATLQPLSIIELGALLLIATPVFRVAASIILFLSEEDRLYALITCAVLVFLLVSIFWIGS